MLPHARSVAAISAFLFLLTSLAPALAITAREKDYQDWRLRCERKDDKSPENCFIMQIAKSTKEKRDVLRIGVRYPEPEKPAMVFLTLPLGVYLPTGLQLQIDDGEKLRIPMEICLPNGCHTRMALVGELLKNLKAGQLAQLVFHDSRQQQITVPVSLAGFTAALAALK
ncbi:MAG: invasion associated locus B family protein [Rhodospirillaceae bacterium]|jgi:invasion protein IalB|nr:invasion associated locus B family protein [Rhodospirillaceae bacterium]MBT4487570.1 invasion associated locus B family protein [Rhodospirillaceae bacterium]MBT5192733.1 invasion associated locus B family protein [Rhodospirillaceae bacterium]MBT5898124.1 invasion associated locus B family protein [Rhodospirillaceae bacterium]MBT6426402.1 invasion associated locus B family protein [Rhodospirillaceae bacterium]